ncbi:hypothetical protein [Streptomyces sp. G1]|uniref:hypothetical protein n=1 Tax=Streptomyces sp. G1 TaxID=361572 RepID=UPI00202F1131|nr:hypothetical protein [Streptomyces sp. G1]MCM1966295.1 hypothetical protein [Streptomyces sp. G1]
MDLRSRAAVALMRAATAGAVCAALIATAGCTAGQVEEQTVDVAESAAAAAGDAVRDGCLDGTDSACYTAAQIRAAYGITGLAAKGITGKGRTIAILDPVGSPNARADLEAYSRKMGLPVPDLRIVQHKP